MDLINMNENRKTFLNTNSMTAHARCGAELAILDIGSNGGHVIEVVA